MPRSIDGGGTSRADRVRPKCSPALRQPTGQPLRVLVVEDQTLIRLDLEQIVADHGGKVVAATASAAASIALVERHAPDVVLMDVSVDGGMDGIEAARVIKGRFASAVVFVTGNADKATHARIVGLRDPHLVLKPVCPHDLATAICRACGLGAG